MPPHNGGPKIEQILRPLSDCMEHNCPSVQIIKALVQLPHCTLGTLDHGHSAFPITLYSEQTFFLPFGDIER